MPDFSICGDPSRRHDFLLLFDCTDGNPNGDPDAGNQPRVDPETMQGLVTDVCVKRKVRNFVTLSREGGSPYGIYVNDQGVALNTLHDDGYKEAGLGSLTAEQKKKPSRDNMSKARDKMCQRFFDVRMFGAVMTTGVNAGQVRGPVQMTFARSVSPIVPLEIAITRVAITNAKDAQTMETGSDASSGDVGKEKRTEMGRKSIIPYGLYVMKGFFTPAFAGQTGVSREDLELFWTALMSMWDLDHSASRGLMACQGLHVFSHADPLGNAPAQSLFKRLDSKLQIPGEPPRRYDDYQVTLDRAALPEGVTLTSLVEN